jgi:molybdopterin converting factor small subunit
MHVTIRFRGPISRQLDDPVFTLAVGETANIRDAIQILLENEKNVKEIWTDIERMDREAMILVNDVDIGLSGGLDTPIHEGDELVILPLVHGG